MRSKSFLRASGAGGTVLTGLAALVLLLSCDDTIGPDSRIDAGDRVPAISDAAHGDLGNPYFFWLAPMVDQPSSAEFGTFDPYAAPELRVLCHFTDDSASPCPDDPIAVFTAITTPGIVIVDEHYQLDFDTQGSFDGYQLQATTSEAVTVYRFQVVLNGTHGVVVAGYADFQLGATGKDVKHLSEDTTTIALKDGRTLPVTFRVETLAYAFGTLVDESDCVDGCSFTKLDGSSTEPQIIAYYDEATGYETTAALFQPGDLPAGDYLAVIEKKVTDEEQGTTGTSTCAYDVDLQKWDCYEYWIYPDVTFSNPIRLGICAESFPETQTPRMAKVDRDLDGNPILLWPDPADVSDFLSCSASNTAVFGPVGNALRYAFDWFVPPLYAQTTVRTIGGMTNDFSDFFLTPEDGLVSHWTADQLEPNAYADAMGINDGAPNGYVSILPDSGVWADAFAFSGSADIVTGGTGIDSVNTLTLSAWVRLNPDAPVDVIQRFVTVLGEKAVLRMDGENYPRQLHFYVNTYDAIEPASAQVDVRADWVLTRGCYHHVVGTADGSKLRLYLNGVGVDSAEYSGDLKTGTGVHLSSLDEPLIGRLDDVMIFNRALAPEEVEWLSTFTRPDLSETCETLSLPDLQVTLAHSPDAPTTAQSVTVTATVTNAGAAPAVESKLLFGETPGDQSWYPVPPLTAGESYSFSIGLSPPVAPGTHTYVATADVDGDVYESEESNNTGTRDFTVVAIPGTLVFEDMNSTSGTVGLYTIPADYFASSGGAAADVRVDLTERSDRYGTVWGDWLAWTAMYLLGGEPYSDLWLDHVDPAQMPVDLSAYVGTQLNIEPAWRPDGTAVAYAGSETVSSPMQFDIYLLPVYPGAATPAGTPVNVTRGQAFFTSESPAWSPDGDSLACVSDRTGDGWSIPILDMTVSDPIIARSIFTGTLRPGSLHWFSNGGTQFFLFAANGRLYVVPTESGIAPLSPITPEYAFVSRPVVSPDGQWVAFQYDADEQGGNEIWAMQLPDLSALGSGGDVVPPGGWSLVTVGYSNPAVADWVP